MASLADDFPVREGVWSDYSRHGLQRKVVTMSNRDAAITVAFLATLVGIAGVRSWRITRFLLFMIFMRNSSFGKNLKDQGTFPKVHPQQVILRNSETATGAAFGFLSGAFTNNLKITTKDAFVILLALGHGIAFIAMSILTSQIILGRIVVSKATSDCGQWDMLNYESDSVLSGLILRLNATLEADNYVQNCYFGATKSGLFDCERLASQSIDFSVDHNAPCPFSSDICLTNHSLAMDTGNVSLSQLGINTRLADQLYLRRRSVCAPIREDPFLVATYDWTNSSMGVDYSLYRFFSESETESPDHIVLHEDRSKAYSIQAYLVLIDETEGESLPPALRLRDPLRDGGHSPSIVLISGRGITFDKQYDDPLWSVHSEVVYPNGTFHGVDMSNTPTAYRMDRDLNIIGCDERYQLCAKHTGRCIPWSGLFPNTNVTLLDDKAVPTAYEFQDLAIPVYLVHSILPRTSIPDSLAGRDGSSALRASRYVHMGQHFHLEPEQWKTEVTYWFAMALARFQLGVYNTIQKPSGADNGKLRNMWANTTLMALCGRVKFRSAHHTSLSFVGVVTVIVVSTCLIFVSFFDLLIDFLPHQGRGLLQWALSENFALLQRKEQLDGESHGDRRDRERQDSGKDGMVIETQPFLQSSPEVTPPVSYDNFRSIRRKPLSHSYS